MKRFISQNMVALAAALLATACGTLEVGVQHAATLVGPTPRASTPRPTPQLAAVTTVAVAPEGVVWYGFGYLSCCPPQGGGGAVRRVGEHTTQFGLADGLPDENVQVLKVAPDGVVWAGAGSHVLRFDGRTWELVDQVARNVTGIVLDIAFTPDGVAWIASPLELLRFDGQICTVYGAMVHALAVGTDGTVWAAGWQGLQDSAFVGSFDGTDWTTFNTIELFGEAVGRIAVTPDERVWGSTARHGVVSFDGDEWKEYTTADGLPSNQIIDLAVAPNGALWAVTDHGVAYFDGQKWCALDDAPGWVNKIAFALDGAIWFGTSTGEVVPHEPAFDSRPGATLSLALAGPASTDPMVK